MARSSRSATGPAEPRPRAEPPPPLEHDPNPGILRAVLHGAYDLLWVVAIVLASPWWGGRALYDRDWRAMVMGRLTFGLPRAPGPDQPRRILIHGVSVGEIKAARSLVQELRRRYSDGELVLSTTTGTGEAVARSLFPGLLVVRFPVDVSWLIWRFLRRTRPRCVILMELEIWPNFLRVANRAGVPVAVVNGRITPRSYDRYRHFKKLLPQFNRISLVCAQDERYAGRFSALGLREERLVVTGNIKVDGLRTGRVEPDPELLRLAAARPGQRVLVAGSTHEPEERMLLEACRGLPDLRVVLVPRHPDRSRELARSLTPAPQLLTRLRAGDEDPDPDRPLLVDTIGELEQVYALADLVFVGGSLIPHGGQNMLEPAAQGLPVLYGPHVANFRQEASLLEEAGASLRLAHVADLAGALERLLGDPEARGRLAAAGVRAVEAQRGAAALTLAALRERCLAPQEGRSRGREGPGGDPDRPSGPARPFIDQS